MNILYITNHLNIGGITSYTLTLASGMKRRGHNVYVASSGGSQAAKLTESGATCFYIPINTKQEASPRILLSGLRLFSFIDEKDIDIIHAHSRTTQVLGCLLGWRKKIPFVSTCHGFFKNRLSRRVLPCWGNRVIAISRQVSDHLVNDFKVDPGAIRIIHNGVDVERFKMQNTKLKIEAREKFGLKDAPVIGIIARLSDVKGHIYLIRAMEEVLREFPAAQLLIIGEGKMKGELVKAAQAHGAYANTVFHPEVGDTRQGLWAMDIFAMPSLKEGLGLSLIEAMAAGCAVIGSDVGGIKSLVRDNLTGLLVPAADYRAIAGAVLTLLRDKEKRESLGQAAQRFVRENFSQGKMVLETERVYLECLNERY